MRPRQLFLTVRGRGRPNSAGLMRLHGKWNGQEGRDLQRNVCDQTNTHSSAPHIYGWDVPDRVMQRRWALGSQMPTPQPSAFPTQQPSWRAPAQQPMQRLRLRSPVPAARTPNEIAQLLVDQMAQVVWQQAHLGGGKRRHSILQALDLEEVGRAEDVYARADGLRHLHICRSQPLNCCPHLRTVRPQLPEAVRHCEAPQVTVLSVETTLQGWS